MVVVILAPALPYNPFNRVVTRLSVGMAGMEHWIVGGVTCVLILGPGFVTRTYAELVGRSHHSG